MSEHIQESSEPAALMKAENLHQKKPQELPLAADVLLHGGVPTAITAAILHWLEEIYPSTVPHSNVIASAGTFGVLAFAISASIYGYRKVEEKADKRMAALALEASTFTFVCSYLIEAAIVKTGKTVTPHGLTLQVIYMGSEFAISFVAFTVLTAAFLGAKNLDNFMTGKNLSDL